MPFLKASEKEFNTVNLTLSRSTSCSPRIKQNHQKHRESFLCKSLRTLFLNLRFGHFFVPQSFSYSCRTLGTWSLTQPRYFGAGLVLSASRDARGCGCQHRAIAQPRHQLLLIPALLLCSSRCASADYRCHLCSRAVLLSPDIIDLSLMLEITFLKFLRLISWKRKDKKYRKTLFSIILLSRYKQSVL